MGISFSLIALKYIQSPFIWMALCWLSIFIFLTVNSKSSVKKSIWFNLAFLVFLLGAVEIYSYFSLVTEKTKSNGRTKVVYTKGYSISNEYLGYGPAKGNAFSSRLFHEDQLIYDVTYTIGRNGLRITPQGRNMKENECVLVFGGSFSFGEGVEDQDAMPYVMGTLQNYKVHNFGFHGYGPHQMLSAIENDLITCNPKLVVYQAISHHVARAAGYSSWDKHGPKYILEDGVLEYAGHFDDAGEGIAWIKKKIEWQFDKSKFFLKFFNKNRYEISNQDIQLFLEIVDSSRKKLAKDHPHAEFHVLLWDVNPEDSTLQLIREGLEKRLIACHLVSGILPGYPKSKSKFVLSPYDGHPNSLGHQMIAKYIVNNIMKEETPSPSQGVGGYGP